MKSVKIVAFATAAVDFMYFDWVLRQEEVPKAGYVPLHQYSDTADTK